MLRLEPSDEALRAGLVHAAEAQEGVHLVDVAPDRPRHEVEAMHQRIARDVEQARARRAACARQGVEQRVALRVAVADSLVDAVADGAGKQERRRRRASLFLWREGRRLERERHRCARPPSTRPVGRDARGHERPHGLAEAVEIGALGRMTRRSVIRTGSAARACPTSRWRRSRRSISRVGRWSAAIRNGRARFRPGGEPRHVVEAQGRSAGAPR